MSPWHSTARFVALLFGLLVLFTEHAAVQPASATPHATMHRAVQQMWMQAVAQQSVPKLQMLLQKRNEFPFDTEQCGDPSRTCAHLALQGYHVAIQSEGGTGSTPGTGNTLLSVLNLLKTEAGVNMTKLCPVVDAIHFRLVDAVDFFLDEMTPLDAHTCIAEQDYFGSNALHILGASMASGFARWFLALRFTYAADLRRDIEKQMGLEYYESNTQSVHGAVRDIGALADPPEFVTFSEVNRAIGTKLLRKVLNAVNASAVAGLLRSKDSQGFTPVMKACAHGNTLALHEFIDFSIKHSEERDTAASSVPVVPRGVVIDALRHDKWNNRTCLDMVRDRGHHETLSLLDSLGIASEMDKRCLASHCPETPSATETSTPGFPPLLESPLPHSYRVVSLCADCQWEGIPLAAMRRVGLVAGTETSDTIADVAANVSTMAESNVAILRVSSEWANIVNPIPTFRFFMNGTYGSTRSAQHARQALERQDQPVVLQGAAWQLLQRDGGGDAFSREYFLSFTGREMVQVAKVPYASSYAQQASKHSIEEFSNTFMGTASVLHAEQLQSILSRAHSNTDELSDDVGVSYVFDSHVLRKTRNPHLQRITNLDLDITLLGTSLQKSTECSTADDASATCRANYTSMFQRGALRLGQFAMGGAFSGAAIHFHGFAINILLTGVRLWFFADPKSKFAQFTAQNAARWWTLGLPDILHQLRHHSEACEEIANGVYLTLQWPGDIVVVPTHWAHATLNLADSIAVALEYSNL